MTYYMSERSQRVKDTVHVYILDSHFYSRQSRLFQTSLSLGSSYGALQVILDNIWYVIPPGSSVSDTDSLSSWAAPEDPQRSLNHLNLLSVVFRTLNVWSPAKTEPRLLPNEIHFSYLCPRIFGYYPIRMAIIEGWTVDQLIHWEVCLMAQLLLHQSTPLQILSDWNHTYSPVHHTQGFLHQLDRFLQPCCQTSGFFICCQDKHQWPSNYSSHLHDGYHEHCPLWFLSITFLGCTRNSSGHVQASPGIPSLH